MAQRRYHYERAFEQYLRARRIPYISVDEARRALLPFTNGEGPSDRRAARGESDDHDSGGGTGGSGGGGGSGGPFQVARDPANPAAGFDVIKAFDFVIYGSTTNLLIEVKGRRVGSAALSKRGGEGALKTGRLESWATEDDIAALTRWRGLFGAGFDAALVFIYWCDAQPPDALFQEVFEYRGVWYALRAVNLDDYVAAMKPRSQRWRTVHVPAAEFERISRPFVRLPEDLAQVEIPAGSEGSRVPGTKTTLIHIPDPPVLGGDSGGGGGGGGGVGGADDDGVFGPLAGSLGRH